MAQRPANSGRRSGKRSAVAALATVALLVLARLCFFTVDSSAYALVTEFGKSVQVIEQPGLGLKYPFQSLQTFDRRLQVYAPSATEFLTLEKNPVVAGSTILWRIADPKKFFETVFDPAGAQSRLADIVYAELGAAIGRSPLTAFVSTDKAAYRSGAILADVTRKCTDVATRDYGIEVVDVQLRSFEFPKQNRLRVYARMTSERGRLSMKYRSEGDEEGTTVRASADQEKSRLLTEALKLAQQYRGEGEAEAARVYGETLSQGAGFYRFLRTMEASRNLVPKGASLLLPADAELFGLLYDSGYYNRGDGSKRVAENPRKEEPMK